MLLQPLRPRELIKNRRSANLYIILIPPYFYMVMYLHFEFVMYNKAHSQKALSLQIYNSGLYCILFLDHRSRM